MGKPVKASGKELKAKQEATKLEKKKVAEPSDSDESDDSDDSDDAPAPAKKAAAPAKVPAKKVEESDDSSDEDDSDDESSEEEPAPKKAAAAPAAKKAKAAAPESSDDSDDDDSDDSEEEKPAAKKAAAAAPAKKAAAKKEESSDDSDDEDDSDDSEEEKPAAKKAAAAAPAKKAAAMEVDSDDEEDSDSDEEEEEKPKNGKRAKAEAKAESEEEEEDEEEEKEEAKPVVKKQRLDLQGNAAATNGGAEESKTVFVGNLSWNATEDMIKKHFKDCGKIASVRVAVDANTGRARGFAHVEFEEASQAQKATSKAGTELDGRAIKVEVTTPRAPRASFGAGGNDAEQDTTTLFVKGFDVNYGSEDDVRAALQEAFGAYGEIKSVRLPSDREAGTLKGFAFIEFSSSEGKDAALELNGTEAVGGYLKVDANVPKRDAGGRGGGRGGFGGRDGGGRGGFGGRGGGRGFGGRDGGRGGGRGFGGRDGGRGRGRGGRDGGRGGFRGGRGGGMRIDTTAGSGKKMSFDD